jgi:hypothetical protein
MASLGLSWAPDPARGWKTVKTLWQLEQRTLVPVSLIRESSTLNLVWHWEQVIIML